jgi:uncharacterized protein (DUF488 family)
MRLPFFTIGHSTRTIEEFVALLQEAGVETVVDIRTIPRSRTNPDYNKDALPANLKPYGLRYKHIAELGGRRGRFKDLDSGVNGFWRNQSFHNYADYALTEEFHEGLDKLIELGRKKTCAIMCSEAVWWRCHRRIVADYLLARGEAVFHLMGAMGALRIEEAHLTEGARLKRARGEKTKDVVYPAPVGARSDSATKERSLKATRHREATDGRRVRSPVEGLQPRARGSRDRSQDAKRFH